MSDILADLDRRAEALRLMGGSAIEADLNQRSIAEISRLRVENERLREALHYYADDHSFPNHGPWGINSTDFSAVASAALEGGNNDPE